VSELATTIGAGAYPALARDIFAAITASVPAFTGMTYRSLGLQGTLAAVPTGATV
jgi:predicted molibdopterin-dependent oxidoreductase YjgC